MLTSHLVKMKAPACTLTFLFLHFYEKSSAWKGIWVLQSQRLSVSLRSSTRFWASSTELFEPQLLHSKMGITRADASLKLFIILYLHVHFPVNILNIFELLSFPD